MDSQHPSKRPNFYLHLHPPTIPARQARFRYTLGAGGLSVFLSFVLAVSGVLLMFYYIPTPDQAGESIQRITYLVSFGSWIRNLHYWSAQLLVLTALIHLFRVVCTGAYSPPRRVNYLVGMFLFALLLLLDFSGYLLRWDEGVRWALVAGTNLLKTIPVMGPSLYVLVMGGNQPNSSSLIRLYSWHVFGLSLAAIFFVGWHIFRLRRDGGIAVAPKSLRQDQERISRGELAQREGFAILLATTVLTLMSLFIPAPIAPPMSATSLSAAEARAPWFFLWVQELLRYGPPFIMGVLIPMAVFALFALIPYIFPSISPNELGTWWPKSGRSAQISFVVLLLALLGITLLALRPSP